ncbi:MAG: Sensor protein QseC, partial [Pseudomonadota bacterium]
MGAQLQVTWQDGPEPTLTVEDSGPGMTASDRVRLGDRFFRVLGTEATGSGLGWSIVRRIAQLNRIKVQLGTSPNFGGLQ